MSLLGIGALLAGLGSIASAGTSIGLGIAGQQQSGSLNKRQIAESARQFDENLAWQREQLKKQQEFYREMSNTAHQREVDDLIAAGLNPVLSATGGSGASSGSVPSPSGVSVHTPSLIDPSSSLNIIQRGMSDALDSLGSNYLKFAQAADSFSSASQRDSLTPYLKDKMNQEANSAAMMANKLNAEAKSIMKLSPAKKAYFEGMTDFFNHKQNYDWWNFGLNSARTISSEVREWINTVKNPFSGFRRGFPKSGDFFRDRDPIEVEPRATESFLYPNL